MNKTYTLCRLLAFQAAVMLTFGWYIPAFAQNDTYCTCIRDTCQACACDFAGCAEAFPDHPSLAACNHPISLLESLDGSTCVIQPVNGAPFGAFKEYFTAAWPWIIGTAAGIAVLWALVGGIEIMLSGSDSGMREQGKGRFLSALAGLLLIGLSGLILEILNPVYFTQ